MLDPVIHKHHDKIDEIQNSVKEEIDNILKEIDIDEVINDPQGSMEVIVEVIKEKILGDYMPDAVDAGIEFAREIAKAKAIKVDDSKDPQKNEAISD